MVNCQWANVVGLLFYFSFGSMSLRNFSPTRGATTVGTGETTMFWSPNFLAVVFKKQEISQQVVTRMYDLASEFSKIFRE